MIELTNARHLNHKKLHLVCVPDKSFLLQICSICCLEFSVCQLAFYFRPLGACVINSYVFSEQHTHTWAWGLPRKAFFSSAVKAPACLAFEAHCSATAAAT